MWLEHVSGTVLDAQKCPTCGGSVQRREHGEMYAGASILDGQRVEIRRIPIEGFIDPFYLDPITQYFDGDLYKRWPSEVYWSCAGRKMHRDVWARAFGPVPPDCHIHHKDNDASNNALANLECLPAREHLRDTWDRVHRGRTISAATREGAAAWHRSEAGRLWHQRQARKEKSWLKQKREKKNCAFCGKEIMALVRQVNSQRFCSATCKSAGRRGSTLVGRAR